ncbi:MAG: hypothetical protein ACPGJV_08930 [Bacteriovoracaceae bacterium]
MSKQNRAKTFIRKITGHISFGEMLHSYPMAQEITQVEIANSEINFL